MKNIRFFVTFLFVVILILSLSGCGGGGGSTDSNPPFAVTFDYSSFPIAPWSLYSPTGELATSNNWGIVSDVGDKAAHFLVPESGTQLSVFLFDNYNDNVNCSVSGRMRILNSSTGHLGLYLRANGIHSRYLLMYSVQTHYLYIQKVDEAMSSYGISQVDLGSSFDPATYHTYKLTIVGNSSTVNFHAYVDDMDTPVLNCTDDGSFSGAPYLSGKTGFFFYVANEGYITDFSVTEP